MFSTLARTGLEPAVVESLLTALKDFAACSCQGSVSIQLDPVGIQLVGIQFL